MGLDMDFYKVNGNGEKEHLHYFRKHSDLNGILQECWMEKNPGKGGDDFNCSEFEITNSEVERVVAFMESRYEEDKHYSGFFWGRSSEEDWEETEDLMVVITEILASGDKVVYTPCW
jgi:hypothetical protein